MFSTVNNFETFKAGRVNLTVVLNTEYFIKNKSIYINPNMTLDHKTSLK